MHVRAISLLKSQQVRGEEEGIRQAVGLSMVNGVPRIWDSRHGMYLAQSTLPMGFASSEFDVLPLCVRFRGGGRGVVYSQRNVSLACVAVVLQ